MCAIPPLRLRPPHELLVHHVGDAVLVAAPRLTGIRHVATTRLSAASPGAALVITCSTRRLATNTNLTSGSKLVAALRTGESPSVENRPGGGAQVGVAVPEAVPGVPTASVLGAPEDCASPA